MKKMISLLTAAAMASMLAACSVSTSPAPTTAQATQAPTTAAQTEAPKETAAQESKAEESKAPETTAAEAVKSDYPNKPITMIIPYGSVGTTYTWGRKLAALLEKNLGQPITCTNQGGASGSIGSQFVREQPSDGYTVLVCAETMGTYRTMNVADLGYDDFTIISPLVGDPKVIVVGKD